MELLGYSLVTLLLPPRAVLAAAWHWHAALIVIPRSATHVPARSEFVTLAWVAIFATRVTNIHIVALSGITRKRLARLNLCSCKSTLAGVANLFRGKVVLREKTNTHAFVF